MTATDPDFEAKVRDSFAHQKIMELIGATLGVVEPGYVTIELPYRTDLTQQNEFVHAGVTTTIADSAGGYAAFSLMPPGASVLTVELKVNLLAPAVGDRFVAEGRVLRSGKTLYVCTLDVTAFKGAEEKACLHGMQTVMCRMP